MDWIDTLQEDAQRAWEAFYRELVLFADDISDWIDGMSGFERILYGSVVVLAVLNIIMRSTKRRQTNFKSSSSGGGMVAVGAFIVGGIAIALLAGAGSLSGIFAA